MEPAAPLITWPDPLVELLGFLSLFLVVGATGFRLAVAGRVLGARGTQAGERAVLLAANHRAAAWGLLGAIGTTTLLALRLPGFAAREHLTVAELLVTNPRVGLQVALVGAALAGFALASARIPWGWGLAALAVWAGPFTNAFFGQWGRLVTPLHRFAAGMWIGTLFVLVVAGLAAVLRSELTPERRGALAAGLVHAFSPLALGSFGILALFGVITAWQHLHVLSNLWRTPYGIALLVKLAIVGGVVALGAWNWKRQKPRLGSEEAVRDLRHTATIELLVATLVLVASAILVSLPSPRPPA